MGRSPSQRVLPGAAILALLALPASACRGEAQRAAPTLPLHPCHLTGAGAQVVDAECGSLVVPEDRSAGPGWRTIALAIAVVRASGRKAAADPLFFLAGGPGQSALEVYPSVAVSFSRMNLARDIVLVDQRGTGQSAPLACPETDVEGTTLSPEEEAALSAACAAKLAESADLRQYTTAIAMDDLDAVRSALGYAKVNLYGASYGTRAALVYLRRHGDHVRSVVLDGVAPPDLALPSSFGRDGERALDLILARCDADPACHAAFPDPKQSLATLLASHETATKVVVPHPTTAAPTTVTVSRATLASTLHALTYESETAALVPLLLHTAAKTGDLGPLAAQSLILADTMKVATGEHLAVLCNEDIPFLDLARVAADGAGSYLGETVAKRYLEGCKAWPRAAVAARDREAVTSSVPVLLLSGELDPVTPPSNATWAARTLPNSLEVVVPGEGHGALQRSCTRRVIDDFVDRASVRGLDTSCLAAARPLRFFTSFAGPQP